jgi:tetratricopeptide (TPR) repeat protein
VDAETQTHRRTSRVLAAALRLTKNSGRVSRSAWSVTGSLLLVLSLSVYAQQDQQPPATPEQIFGSALVLQRKVASASSAADAISLLQKAAGQYAEVARLRPDFYPAQAMWADCLQELAHRVSDPQQHRVFLQSARERFAAAAQCPGATWKLYHDWARFLATDVAAATPNAQERSAALDEATKRIEKGLELASFSGDRAKLECLWGMCLFRLAEESASPTKQRELYEQAAAKFEGATKVESEAKTARTYNVWGLALLRLAKLSRNRMLIHQAIERLLTALEKDPNLPDTHYNLACAYAVGGQPQQAMQHLRVCLQHDDPQHTFRAAASSDPDLGSLWTAPEFREMVEPPKLPSAGEPAIR